MTFLTNNSPSVGNTIKWGTEGAYMLLFVGLFLNASELTKSVNAFSVPPLNLNIVCFNLL